jgi:hypothetical protein
MFKLASFVLAYRTPAEAAHVIGVAVPVSGVTIVPPSVVAVDPYYVPAPYYYPGFVRYGYGYRYGYGREYRWGHVYGHFHGGFRGHR